jgi:hypothetical protein
MTTDVYGRPPKKPNPLAWLAIGCAVAFVGFVAFVVFILVAVFGSMRSSTPYKDSLAIAQSDPRVIAALGSPVKTGLFLSGSIHTRDDSGEAKLAIPLSGPKGEGTLHVEASKVRGNWTYHVVKVVGTGWEINLLSESPGTAPPAV